MLHLFIDLELHITIMLILALFFVCIYEFINGFHDTANSVVIVIYTCALKHQIAVFLSGLFNFLGVMFSGLSVAYTIIHLFPNNIIINTNAIYSLSMVISILLAAIILNLITWYFGLPTSSSHTLIGTIVGIGIVNAFTTHCSITESLNVNQLIAIFLSLIISPIIGLLLAVCLIYLLYCYSNNFKKTKHIHLTPTEKAKKHGKKQPSFWLRISLILSATGVSFSHGANDGQKGIGLIMLIFIGVAPASFAINLNANTYEIKKTYIAVHNLKQYYCQNLSKINKFLESYKYTTIHYAKYKENPIHNRILQHKINGTNLIKKQLNTKEIKTPIDIEMQSSNIKKLYIDEIINIQTALNILENIQNYNQLQPCDRYQIRNILINLADFIEKLITIPHTTDTDKKFLQNLKKELLKTVEYAPLWIITTVALCLSLGTIIGWRRIAITIGEKIGKKEITYAQGLSTQITTGISIGIASYTGMPVSTTHVLSSAVTGTMLFHGSGLQRKTIKNILLTWILTMPIAILLSSILYLLIVKII